MDIFETIQLLSDLGGLLFLLFLVGMIAHEVYVSVANWWRDRCAGQDFQHSYLRHPEFRVKRRRSSIWQW